MAERGQAVQGAGMQPVRLSPEQDGFWEAVEVALFTRQRRSDAPREVESIITLLGLRPGIQLLDLPCGIGRHALEFVRRGFRVTGVDATRSYLDKASAQSEAEGLTIEFVHQDMRTFCRPDTFDVVLNLFTSFGYSRDPEDDRRILTNVRDSLKDDGRFLLETFGKEIVGRSQPRSWFEADGSIVLHESTIGKDWTWIDEHIIVLKDGARSDLTLGYRLYSATELSALMSECGFSHVDVYGDLADRPYDRSARRLVVVARK